MTGALSALLLECELWGMVFHYTIRADVIKDFVMYTALLIPYKKNMPKPSLFHINIPFFSIHFLDGIQN